jgi:predicted HAD superfamily Cof-like phosphohydrolase
VLDAVHTSNMTKLGADGRPVRRPDGKILKGPGYRPPEIAAVLHRLMDDIVTGDAAGSLPDDRPGASVRA